MDPINVFHAGPQKSATTWLYRCCQQHPGIVTAGTDAVHFFDLHHHRGTEWFAECFPEDVDGVKIDFTPSYIRDPLALERIQAYNPQARVALHVRDPIDRCVSHYWHERKKRRFNYKLSEVLENYDLFANWVVPGLYGAAVARCHELFGAERTHVIFHEDIRDQPEAVLRDFFRFIGVDADFEPTVARVWVNQSQGFWSYHAKKAARSSLGLIDRCTGGHATVAVQRLYDRRRAQHGVAAGHAGEAVATQPGAGMTDTVLRAELIERFRSDMRELHARVGRVPSGWERVIEDE